jgi:hypothetical protein
MSPATERRRERRPLQSMFMLMHIEKAEAFVEVIDQLMQEMNDVVIMTST